MDNSMPILLVPGLVGSARIYAPVLPALWRFGPVTVANQIRDDHMAAIARRILAEAPPRFSLIGHSIGGYIVFEMMRQAPERVARLALINTQARPDTPEATARRRGMMARATAGQYRAVRDELSRASCIRRAAKMRPAPARLRHGRRYRAGGLRPPADGHDRRPDSRPMLAGIACPTLVLSGDEDNTIPNSLSMEMADNIPDAKLVILPIAATCRSSNSRRLRRRAGRMA